MEVSSTGIENRHGGTLVKIFEGSSRVLEELSEDLNQVLTSEESMFFKFLFGSTKVLFNDLAKVFENLGESLQKSLGEGTTCK